MCAAVMKIIFLKFSVLRQLKTRKEGVFPNGMDNNDGGCGGDSGGFGGGGGLRIGSRYARSCTSAVVFLSVLDRKSVV